MATKPRTSNLAVLASLKKRFPAFKWTRNENQELKGWFTDTVNDRWISVIRPTDDLVVYLFNAAGNVLGDEIPCKVRDLDKAVVKLKKLLA